MVLAINYQPEVGQGAAGEVRGSGTDLRSARNGAPLPRPPPALQRPPRATPGPPHAAPAPHLTPGHAGLHQGVVREAGRQDRVQPGAAARARAPACCGHPTTSFAAATWRQHRQRPPHTPHGRPSRMWCMQGPGGAECEARGRPAALHRRCRMHTHRGHYAAACLHGWGARPHCPHLHPPARHNTFMNPTCHLISSPALLRPARLQLVPGCTPCAQTAASQTAAGGFTKGHPGTPALQLSDTPQSTLRPHP